MGKDLRSMEWAWHIALDWKGGKALQDLEEAIAMLSLFQNGDGESLKLVIALVKD